MEAAARTLFKSLQKFAAREDWLQLWPGHGAGSACGKGISAIPSSTLGYERRFNWAFQIKSEAEFVEKVLAGQPEPPKYFAMMKKVNKEGPALVIDTRPADDYARGHAAGSINIPFNGAFVTWAGWLIPYDRDFFVITDRPDDVRRALALIGLDRIAGFLPPAAGPETIAQVAAADLAPRLDSVTVVDVRGANEWAGGHLPGAVHIPLGYLGDRAGEIPAGRPIVVQCQAGGRSAIAASVLERLGFDNVTNLSGGINAWAAAGLPVEGEQRATQAA
jgi:hydroxyacylglutathione hydrolase